MPMGTHIHRMKAQAAIGLAIVASMTTLAASAHAAKHADFGTARSAPPASGSVAKPPAIVAGTNTVFATAAVSNLPLCPASGDQSPPVYVSDGSGGGIAVWSDNRNGHYDIYAQRIDANGDPMWALGGVVVCKAAGDQVNPAAVADGAGGAIIAWEDPRTDFANPDIYAQRLTAAGVEQWTTDGVLVSGAAGQQQTPAIVSDGMSGAIV